MGLPEGPRVAERLSATGRERLALHGGGEPSGLSGIAGPLMAGVMKRASTHGLRWASRS